MVDQERERYERYVEDITGNPTNPIERRVKSVGRGVKAFWMILAFVVLLLLLVFFDEAVLGQQIL